MWPVASHLRSWSPMKKTKNMVHWTQLTHVVWNMWNTTDVHTELNYYAEHTEYDQHIELTVHTQRDRDPDHSMFWFESCVFYAIWVFSMSSLVQILVLLSQWLWVWSRRSLFNPGIRNVRIHTCECTYQPSILGFRVWSKECGVQRPGCIYTWSQSDPLGHYNYVIYTGVSQAGTYSCV
jgi:hypothetical protein